MLYTERANELMQEGDYSKAINYYTLAIKSDLDNTKLYSSRAKAYYHHLKSSNAGMNHQQQWKKVIDDCTSALNLDKANYDAMYYQALVHIYGYNKLERGLKLLEAAYRKSLARAKSYKLYSLPQEIYVAILDAKKMKRDTALEESLTESNPLFNKLVYLLQENYQRELQEVFSKDIDKSLLSQATTELAIKYNNEIKELIEMFKLKYGTDSSTSSSKKGNSPPESECSLDEEEIDAPDYLCDPISFHLFHEPMVTPSGQSFEKSWLWQHLAQHQYDPLTRQKLAKEQCYPNLGLKRCVDLYLASKGKLK